MNRGIGLMVLLFFLGGAWAFAQSSFSQGEQFFVDNKPKDALPLLEAAVEEEPDNMAAFLHLGIIYLQLEQYDAAIAVYLQILPKGGEEAANIAYNLGNAYYSKGDYTEAEYYYSQAIESNPALGSAYLNRANTKISLGFIKDAIADYQQFITLVPKSPKRPRIERLLAFIKAELAADERRRAVVDAQAQAAYEARASAEEAKAAAAAAQAAAAQAQATAAAAAAVAAQAAMAERQGQGAEVPTKTDLGAQGTAERQAGTLEGDQALPDDTAAQTAAEHQEEASEEGTSAETDAATQEPAERPGSTDAEASAPAAGSAAAQGTAERLGSTDAGTSAPAAGNAAAQGTAAQRPAERSEAQAKAEQARQAAEAKRQEQAARQAEAKRQTDIRAEQTRQAAETKRQEQAARQAETAQRREQETRAAETQRQTEAQATAARQAAEAERRRKLVEDVATSLQASAAGFTGLSAGSDDVQSYDGEFELK